MTIIESEKVEINNSSENIYNFLSDFNNFEKIMPNQVINFESTIDECSFTLQGVPVIGMHIVDRLPNSEIRIESTVKSPFEFNLSCKIDNTDKDKCNSQLVFESELDPMMEMLVENLLQNFFNLLVEKLKEIND
ncbi:MAG: hypothetical protein ABII90_10700 [Bacteroidota bacterium]